MDNKKNKIQTFIAIIVLLIIVIAGTYAFFAPQAGGTTSNDTTVTSNTTDLLTFSINRDIAFTVTQNDFQENGTNQSGDATATATLTPNNKTGSATMNYYLYLNIENNPISYSEANTNRLPELMLQVFDSSNQLVTLSGLGNQVTVKGVTGYDITGVRGLKTLLDNHAISASNNTATIENWRIIITLINHDFNQNDNTGKEVSAEIIIQKEELSLGFTGTIYRNNNTYTINGTSIEPHESWCDVRTSSGNIYKCFLSEQECNQFLVDNGRTGRDTCESILTELSYETSLITLGGYFPIGPEHLTAEYALLFETEDYCLNYIDAFYDRDTYTCTHATIVQPYYLKQEVVDNIIQGSEACLYYNNNEFCLGPNYWVEGDTTGLLTKNKLQTEMEATLGVSADNCDYNSGSTSCNFGRFNCLVNEDGLEDCVFFESDIGVGCVIDNGNAYCHR